MLGLLVWGGLYLRDARLRELIPLRRCLPKHRSDKLSALKGDEMLIQPYLLLDGRCERRSSSIVERSAPRLRP